MKQRIEAMKKRSNEEAKKQTNKHKQTKKPKSEGAKKSGQKSHFKHESGLTVYVEREVTSQESRHLTGNSPYTGNIHTFTQLDKVNEIRNEADDSANSKAQEIAEDERHSRMVLGGEQSGEPLWIARGCGKEKSYCF